jgi:Tol biopolymer transport system component
MKNHFVPVIALALSTVSVSCGDSPEPVAPLRPTGAAMRALEDAPAYSAWSAPVNVGAPVNTIAVEQAPTISRDGLTMFFHCICPGSLGGSDIYVTSRASIDAPWGTPLNLGATINTAVTEGSPSLSKDGHRLFFNSSRSGGFGSGDIYMSRRHNTDDNLGWETPVNLGPGVNSAADENSPEYTEDESGTVVLYFASNRAGGLGEGDIYFATMQTDETFGAPVAVTALNSAFRDSGVGIRRDGLEVYFVSERPGGVGAADIWTSSRSSTSDEWSAPVNVGSPINLQGNDAAPSFSFDGLTLYFHTANRAGNIDGPFFDIWYVTRTKVKGGGE